LDFQGDRDSQQQNVGFRGCSITTFGAKTFLQLLCRAPKRSSCWYDNSPLILFLPLHVDANLDLFLPRLFTTRGATPVLEDGKSKIKVLADVAAGGLLVP
jgi:hypothetical protein